MLIAPTYTALALPRHLKSTILTTQPWLMLPESELRALYTANGDSVTSPNNRNHNETIMKAKQFMSIMMSRTPKQVVNR